jgi:WhiB family redox-sensing transcriptional regulator
LANWRTKALCAKDRNSIYWFSYKHEDVQYAKNICQSCEVRKECLINAWGEDVIYGVNGGYSEFDILLATWKKAKKENDSNWNRTDRTLQKLLRKAE